MKMVDLLQTYAVPYVGEGEHHHARPGWLQLDCPFCGRGTNKYHLGFNITSGYFNCWHCGSHSVPSVLVALLDIGWEKAKELAKQVTNDKTVHREELRGKLVLPRNLGPLNDEHKRYLISRGFCPSMLVKRWHIQGIGWGLRLAHRIFIPIHYKGRVVSYTTRSVRTDTLRYVSAPARHELINHKTLLYGEDYCRWGVVCTEGPVDAWRIGPGAVSTCGTGFSREQVRRLARFPVRGVCFDVSKPAQKRAKDLVHLLSPFPGVTYNIELETGEDPAEASEKEINQIRTHFQLC